LLSALALNHFTTEARKARKQTTENSLRVNGTPTKSLAVFRGLFPGSESTTEARRTRKQPRQP